MTSPRSWDIRADPSFKLVDDLETIISSSFTFCVVLHIPESFVIAHLQNQWLTAVESNF